MRFADRQPRAGERNLASNNTLRSAAVSVARTTSTSIPVATA
ncbi:MAG: hypothetical protein ACOH1Y_16395 [Propionicimonas sp.]